MSGKYNSTVPTKKTLEINILCKENNDSPTDNISEPNSYCSTESDLMYFETNDQSENPDELPEQNVSRSLWCNKGVLPARYAQLAQSETIIESKTYKEAVTPKERHEWKLSLGSCSCSSKYKRHRLQVDKQNNTRHQWKNYIFLSTSLSIWYNRLYLLNIKTSYVSLIKAYTGYQAVR